LAITQFSVLSSKLKRAATFQELVRGLNVYRATIDCDIKANGLDPKKKEEKVTGKGKGGNNSNKPKAQFGAFAVEASVGASYVQDGKQKGNGDSKRKGGKKGEGNGRGKVDGNPKPYCSLCGQTNHTAVQGCQVMKDNGGNPVRVDPVQQTCPECPPHVSTRLNHPAKLCPWRPSGPWHKGRWLASGQDAQALDRTARACKPAQEESSLASRLFEIAGYSGISATAFMVKARNMEKLIDKKVFFNRTYRLFSEYSAMLQSFGNILLLWNTKT
jgi:hypothetical protein